MTLKNYEVMCKILENERCEVTSTLQKDTALEISGIGYRLIKNVNIKMKKKEKKELMFNLQQIYKKRIIHVCYHNSFTL